MSNKVESNSVFLTSSWLSISEFHFTFVVRKIKVVLNISIFAHTQKGLKQTNRKRLKVDLFLLYEAHYFCLVQLKSTFSIATLTSTYKSLTCPKSEKYS